METKTATMTAPFHYSALPQRRWQSVVDVVPARVLVDWAARLFTLMNLAWQYVDTVCDLCIQMRLGETKPLVRRVRELKRGYDQFRARSIDSEGVGKETERSESFEDLFSDDFRKLFIGLENEAGRLSLTGGRRSLVVAVHQALAVMDAVRVYARRLDRVISTEYGLDVPDCCLVQKEFLALYPLMPKFAGADYRPNPEARRLTASILANRMEAVKIRINEV